MLALPTHLTSTGPRSRPTRTRTSPPHSTECVDTGIFSGCDELKAARGAGTAAVVCLGALAIVAGRALSKGFFDTTYIVSTILLTLATVITCAVTLGTWDTYMSFALNYYTNHFSSSWFLYLAALLLTLFGNIPTFFCCKRPPAEAPEAVDVEQAEARPQVIRLDTIGSSETDSPAAEAAQSEGHGGQTLLVPGGAGRFQAGGAHTPQRNAAPGLPLAHPASAGYPRAQGRASSPLPSAPPAASFASGGAAADAPPAYDDIYPGGPGGGK